MRMLMSVALAVFLGIGVTAAQHRAGICRPVGKSQLLADVPEASGVAMGRRTPGTMWTHNDSGKPVLFRFDGAGRATLIAVTGADVRDWEDIAIAKCPVGECLYIADIGDNRGSRKQITIYRAPEPALGSAAAVAVEAFHATYPDYPHDAEALVVTASGQVLIITKEVPPRLYQLPTPLKPGATVKLQLIRLLNERIRITGGAASADGRWIALRSNATLLLYPNDDLVNGRDPIRVDLTGLKEPQGEGVAFGRDGDLYLVSEGGEDAFAGVVTRLNCALPK